MPTIVPILIVVIIALLFLVVIIYSFKFIHKRNSKVILDTASKNSKVSKAISGVDKKNQESIYLAIDRLKKVLNNNPDDLECRKELADLYVSSNAFQPAAKEYLTILDRCEKMSPSVEMDILSKLGDIYLKNNQLDEALKYFHLLKQKDNSNLKANLNLGIIFVKRDQPDKALILLRAVNKIEPQNIEALKYMGLASYNLDKHQDACNYYNMLSQIQPLDDESIFYKGASHYHIGQITDAFTCFDRVVNNPEFEAQSAYYLGCIYRKKNDLIVANEFFEKAIRTGKLRPAMAAEAHYIVADNYINLHNLRLAMAHWDAIMRVNPKYKDVANKMNTYSGVASNSLMEDYMIGKPDRFIKICTAFAQFYVKKSSSLIGGTITIRDAYKSDAGYSIIAEIKNSSSVETYYFLFIRSTGITGDVIVRTINNKMKEDKIDKGVCVTCGTFSDYAKDYVASRMIDAIDKDGAKDILSRLHI